MKRLFYNCSVLMLFLLGWSMSYAQPGCPPNGTVPTVTPKVCINSIPGTYDLSQEGTGAAAGVVGWKFFSAITTGGLPINPVTTIQVAPETYYAVYVDNNGNPCLDGIFPPTYSVATLEVVLKPQPPFQTMTVCADNTPPSLGPALLGGVYDLTQIPGIDKWFTDPAGITPVVITQSVPPGTYYGSVDANNTSNGCESELAVLTVNPAPYPPIITAPVGTLCVDPVTGTFDLNTLEVRVNWPDPNYPPGFPNTIIVPVNRRVFTTDAALTTVTGGVVPAGTYYVYHTLFQCASMPLEFTINPRPAAPVLSATSACADDVSGDYDLCNVTSTNPAGVTLTWYASLADVSAGNDIGSCPPGFANQLPGTYYATYTSVVTGCESAPSAFEIYETPAALTGYNCQGVAGNNPPPNGGNCVGGDGEQVIRLFSCTDDVFTVTGVEDKIKMNDAYGFGINGPVIANAVLTYYDTYADADAGNSPVTIASIVARFNANAASNNNQTEYVYVTQTDPNTGCESAPAGLRLRMRVRPVIVVTTPDPICIGQTVDLWTLVEDTKNTAESWNIYDLDPTAGPAVLLSSSPADANGEPDGSIVFQPSFTTAGTYTFWYEAVNEDGPYNADCNAVASVTITVLPKPVITAQVVSSPVCSGEPFSIIFLDANGFPIPSATVNDVDVSVNVAGGLNVVSGPTTGLGLTIGAISGDVYENFTSGPLNVTYTVTPNGPLPQNCPGDPINVVVTINPEPIMTAGLTDTICSYNTSNLVLSHTNNLLGGGVTYKWVDKPLPSIFPFSPAAPNPVLDGPASDHTKYPNPLANYGRPVASAAPITDSYRNVALGDKEAVYTIIPVSAAGCEGNPETAKVVTNPAPVITFPLGDTICSGGTTNIALSVNLPDNIDAVAYKWDVPAVYPAGVTGPATGSGGTNPGSYVYVPVPVPGQIFIQETFTNTSGSVQFVTLDLTALGDPVNANLKNPNGCESLTFPVIIRINPEPVLTSNWPALLCSNNPTVDLNVVTPTETSGVPCTGVWERWVAGTWVTVTGVQTVSNGDQFRYTCTTVYGCTSSLTETVNLEDAPVMTAVPNPPLCADNVNLAAKIIDMNTYQPTVTNSVGGPIAGSGSWTKYGVPVPNGLLATQTVRNGDTYCYTFNAANGCSEQVCYTFIINPLPNAILTGGGTICPPATSTNDVVISFTTTGPWDIAYTIDGGTPIVVNNIGTATYTIAGSGSTPGMYQVTSILDGNGCSTPVGYKSNSVNVAAPNTIAAICRNITEQLDGNGFAAITGGDIDENSGYGCNSAITLTRLAYPPIFTCADLGVNDVTLKVFDGNTAAPHDTAYCVSKVTIEDNIKPSIVCATVANPYNTDPGVCYWEVPNAQLDPLFTSDNCTVVSVEHNGASKGLTGTYTNASLAGAQFPKGSTIITWTVTDQSGNQAACAYQITVEDDEAPVITSCPPSRDIYTSANALYDCASIIPDMLGELTWTDNCPQCVTISQDPAGPSAVSGQHLDQTLVIFHVMDDAHDVTCTATLTLIDDQDPQFTFCPPAVTVECSDPNRSIADLGNATATDNCAATVTITHSDVVDLTQCNNTGTIVRTFTADDGHGNTISTCSQVITVEDATNPVITGFNDPTEYCSFVNVPRFDYAAFLAAGGTASDNCGLNIASFTFISQNIIGNCNPNPSIIEKYAIYDNCGNGDTATVTFIINDSQDPVWTNNPAIADVTINCEDDNTSVGTGVPAWTDNCASNIAESQTSTGYSANPANCGHYTYTIFRTFTVTDICGNTISHTQTINVEDVTDPVISCTSNIPGNAVDTDVDKCEATIGSGLLTASATDNCATANLSYSYVVTDNNNGGQVVGGGLGSDAAGVYYKGSYTITFTATDPCGNSASCSLQLDVEDNQDPYVACKGTLDVYLDDQGVATIANGDIVTASSDNCPGATIALDKYSFDCSEVTAVTGNTITVTATITDASGNTESCATVVTVIDNLPPTPDCQDHTVYLSGVCTASITAADVAGNASDNCAIVSTTATPLTFNGSDLTVLSGNNPNPPVNVTVTYIDPSGNVSQCVAKVTVKDTIPPSITCLSPAPVNNAPGLCEAYVVVPVPSAGDNCQVTTLTNDYTGLPSASAVYPVGTTVVTWTVYDFAGNSTDCVINVVVNDVEDPNAICKDITVQLDATGNASITAADLDNGSNDNCPGFSLALNDYDFDCSDIQGQFNTNNVVAVTLTVTDGAGLTDQATCNVTVRDEVDPTAICQDVTVQLDATGNGSTTAAAIDNGSSDACGLFSVTAGPLLAFDCSHVGTNPVTLQVIDNNGNIDYANCTITVEDNVDPIALCQDTTVQLDVNGNGVLTTAMVDDGSSDACGIASMTVSPNTFDCSQRNQTINVTLTVTDNNGNVSTCTSDVLVKDEVSPTAKCRDLTIQLDANGDASITVADVDNGTVDNCLLVSVTLDDYDFDCNDVGTNTVTLTAVDADGNTGTCISTITVEDNVDPTALCMNTVVELDSTGNGSIAVSDIDAGSSDACGLASLTLSDYDYDCGDLGNNTVTLTIVDNNGNSSSCQATVDVQDNIDPNVDASDITVCNDAGVCEAAVSIVATEWDNCTIVSRTYAGTVNPFYGSPYAINGAGLDASGTYPVGSATITFTVIDQSGNSDQVTITLTVNDCEAPVITQAEGLCGGSVTLPNVTGDCYQQFAWTTPTAWDNCKSPQPMVRTISNPSVQPLMIAGTTLGLFPVGTTTVTYTATDDYANVTVCAFDVIVEDTESPTILNCPTAAISVAADPGSCSAQVVLPNNITGIDNCPIVTMSDDVPAGSVFPLGTTTVTFTAADGSGNTTTCVFDVNVADTQAPVITCPANITASNDPGECAATVSYPDPTWTDNCTGFAAGGVMSPANLTAVNSLFAAGSSIPANVQPSIPLSSTVGAGNGSVNLSNAPSFIVMTGNDANFDVDGSGVSFTATSASTLTFNYLYSTNDVAAVYDPFGYAINGVYTPVVNGPSSLTVSDVVSVNLAPGDVFTWVTLGDGFFGTSTVVISDPSLLPLGQTALYQIAGLGSGAQFPLGTTTETWVIRDAAGNADTCSFTVTVTDTEDPTIIAVGATQNLSGANTIGGPIPAIGTSGTSEFFIPIPQNQTIADVNVSLEGTHSWVGDLDVFLTSPTGTIVHLLDNVGGSLDDFNMTFDDEASTQIISLGTSPLGGGLSWRSNGTGEDPTGANGNIGGNPTTLAAFDGQSTLGVWKLTIVDRFGGDSGNLTKWSLSIDYYTPGVALPVNTTVANDPGQCGAVVNYATLLADDNCPGVSLVQTAGLGTGSMFPVGTTTETYVATDAAGNTTTLSFDITVEDTEDPTITCPTSATIGNDAGDCDATLLYTITAADNCSYTISQTAGVGNGGSVAVGASSTETYVVVDGAGNTATCSFTITVEDQEAPQISGCPANITLNNDPGQCGAVATWNTNNLVTSDNCPGETLASNYQSGDFFPVGTTTVVYTVTDAAGLTADCSFDVTVIDNEDPVITCPANVTVTQDLSLFPNCGANITGFVASATDNCSATIVNDYNAGGADASDFYGLGVTTVTFTATDPAGNTDVCSATVTVNPVAPVATVNNANPMDICSTSASITASGNTPGTGFSGQWTASPSAGVVFANATAASTNVTFPGAGSYTLTWTVTNICSGVSASASFTVNVYDPPVLTMSGTDPTLVGASDGTATVAAAGGSGSFGYAWSNGGSTATITGLTAGTYTVTVTDLVSGCTSTGSVTLNDPPVTRICELKDWDANAYGVWFRLAPGSIGGNGNNVWVGGYGTYEEYASGEVHIFGTIADKVDPTKSWSVDIWLIGKQFWGSWGGAGNGWAGTAANVGTNYASWTYYTLNGSKSTMTGLGSYAGASVTLTHRPYAANGGNGGFQIGQAANNHNTDYGMYGQFDYTGTYSGWGEISGRFNNCIGTMRLGPVAVLQGAFDGTSGLMRDDLRSASLVPATEPYTALGYTHVGGGGSETVAQSVLNVTGMDAIVDWVIVELRESANPANIVASRSALMQADGDIVDVDGVSSVEFNAVVDGDYHVAVLHRNHVGIMTGNALTLVSGASATTVDFTTTSLYGGPTAYATVGAGFQALVAGDANGDGQVQNTDDVYFWAPSTGSSGYQAGDYDLDGQVQNTDKVYYWISNAGLGTAIPQ